MRNIDISSLNKMIQKLALARFDSLLKSGFNAIVYCERKCLVVWCSVFGGECVRRGMLRTRRDVHENSVVPISTLHYFLEQSK